MTNTVHSAVVWFVHPLRVGPMRMSVYGLCAAVGLVVAMALARMCARRVGVDPEKVWDAGVFAIVSCFLASRVLLVLFDVKAFLHYPLLVLSLPSLTFAGMALAAVMVWFYLRRKRVPVLRMMDVFAVPGAVLAGFLELGNALDGSELGMPMRYTATGEVAQLHPVSAYGFLASLAVAALLWRVFIRGLAAGATAGIALMLGGFAAYALDLVTQPSVVFQDWWIEPGQIVALCMMVAGALLWTLATRVSETEAAAVSVGVSAGRVHEEVR